MVGVVTANDRQTLDVFQLVCQVEGTITAPKPSRALNELILRLPGDRIIVLNLWARGD
ncbi:MAG: hypothetical protein AAF797_03575 [Planctomycetota bacterium]